MYTETQVRIAKQQPLAVFVHCLMHAGNVVAQQAMGSSNVIQDAASLTNDIAGKCNRSTKLTNILPVLKHDRASLRPLCPNRMMVRGAALKVVLNQHESVVQALSEYAKASSEETASKAQTPTQTYHRW